MNQAKYRLLGRNLTGKLLPMEIGNRIARARTMAGMSQTELANAVGVSRGLVGQWESHKKKPGRELLAKIAAVTLVSMSSLMFDQPTGNEGVVVTDAESLKMLRIFKKMSPRQRKNVLDLFGISADVAREIEHQSSPTKPKIPVG